MRSSVLTGTAPDKDIDLDEAIDRLSNTTLAFSEATNLSFQGEDREDIIHLVARIGQCVNLLVCAFLVSIIDDPWFYLGLPAGYVLIEGVRKVALWVNERSADRAIDALYE